MKVVLSTILISALCVFGLAEPAHATSYDFAVTATATANTTTVPSVITWHITVDSVGDNMGSGGAEEGIVSFTAPATISLVISDDCDTTGNYVECSFYVEDGVDDYFEVSGLVALTALGDITVTPTITSIAVRTDSGSSNDSDPVSCTAVTSVLVTC